MQAPPAVLPAQPTVMQAQPPAALQEGTDIKNLPQDANLPRSPPNLNSQPGSSLQQSPYPDPTGPDFNPTLSGKTAVDDSKNTIKNGNVNQGPDKGAKLTPPNGAGSSGVSMVTHLCIFTLAAMMRY